VTQISVPPPTTTQSGPTHNIMISSALARSWLTTNHRCNARFIRFSK